MPPSCRTFLALPFLVLAFAALSPAETATPDDAAADEKLLKDADIAADGPGLLTFLRGRTLAEEDRARLAALVRQLGDDDFPKREEASKALVARGRLAIPFLKPALKDADYEIVRRAAQCLSEIEGGPGPALPAAAVRCLARKKPAGAVEALLRYVPHADDEFVEDEVLAALRALALRGGKPDPALLTALRDREPARRGAAAFVVGAADKEQRREAAKLLSDDSASVRFRAAQGFLAARDADAVPALIDLLRDGPDEVRWRAEDLLVRLAGEKAPAVSVHSDEERKQAHAAWSAWWKENAGKADLARVEQGDAFLNLTLVCEMHGNTIWECDRTGKVRWKLGGLNCPRDAQVLPGGRVLVTEVNARRVAELDMSGKVLWSHAVDDPAFVRRLPNGNTFIGNHHRAFEVTPAGKEVFSYKPEENFLIHSMDRRRNGNVVCLSMDGLLREVDPRGKTVREFRMPLQGNWCGVQALPGNRYLAVELSGNVRELDAAGKVQWECKIDGACYAQRLPNGETMICSFNGRRVVHVNREGKVVFEKAVGTQPWRAHCR